MRASAAPLTVRFTRLWESGTTLSAVQSLTSEWLALLERSPCHRVFSSPAWFLAACRAWDLEPLVVTIRREGELVGLLPLVVDAPRRRARFATDLTDYNDLVAAPEDDLAGPLLHAALRSAADRGCERLVLENLREDSPLLEAAERCASADPREPGPPCPYRILPASYEEYLAGRSAHYRDKLGQLRRRAAAEGVAIRRFTPAELPPERLPGLFLELHFGRFGGRTCFDPAPAQRFVAEALPPLFAEGTVEVFALFAGDEPVAIQVCFRSGNSLANWNGGFLPSAVRWSPGRLLIEAAIERAIESGCTVYDLMRGEETYKAQWASGFHRLWRIEVPCSPETA